jgi:predicted N-acetyltransferase YhbS
MLAVDKNYRKRGIGSELVSRVGETLKDKGAQEVSL